MSPAALLLYLRLLQITLANDSVSFPNRLLLLNPFSLYIPIYELPLGCGPVLLVFASSALRLVSLIELQDKSELVALLHQSHALSPIFPRLFLLCVLT